MITKKTYRVAAESAMALSNMGISVDGGNGRTPLAELSILSGLDLDDETRRGDDGFLDMDMSMLRCDSSISHEQALKGLSNRISDTVSSQLSVLRASVIPLVKQTFNVCETEIADANDRFGDGYSGGWTVVKSTFPEFLYDSMFALDHDNTSGRTFELPKNLGLLQYKAKGDIIKLLMTGDDDIDPLILKTISECSVYFDFNRDDLIQCIWNTFFSTEKHPTLHLSKEWFSLANPLVAASVYSIVYLLAKNVSTLIDDDPLTPEGYDEDAGGRKALSLSRWAIAGAWTKDFSYEHTKKQGHIVIMVEKGNKLLLVETEAYDEWIDDDANTNILLIGTAVVSGASQLTLGHMDKFKDQAVKHIEQLIALEKTTVILSTKEKLRYLIRSNLRITGREDLTGIELQWSSEHENYIKEANAAIDRILSTLPSVSLTGVATLIERCLSEGRFSFCDSGVLLEAIKRNSEMTLKESELTASIEYGCKWLVGQMSTYHAKSN